MSGCIDRIDGVAAGGSGGSLSVQQGAIYEDVVAANATGSTDVLVIRFSGPSSAVGPVALVDWIVRTDSAALGTTFVITQPGVYGVNLYIPWNTGATVASSITLNATAAQRQTTNPNVRDPEVYFLTFNNATGGFESQAAVTAIPITSTMIAAGTNIVRCQATNGFGGAPAVGDWLLPSSVNCRIFRIAEGS